MRKRALCAAMILCLLAGAFTAVNAGEEPVEEAMPF